MVYVVILNPCQNYSGVLRISTIETYLDLSLQEKYFYVFKSIYHKMILRSSLHP